MDVTVDLYDANKGKTPRTGGPYRDDIEQEQAELLRSKFENREPNFDNPGPSAGTLLVPKSQLVERDTDKSHISDTIEVVNEPVGSYDYVEPVYEADPTQPDFDNDMTRIAALDAGLKLQELKDKASSQAPVAEESTPVTEEKFDV